MLLVKKGWTAHAIAEAFGVHPRTIQQWKQHQREHGTASLLSDGRGRKEGQLPDARSERELQKQIIGQMRSCQRQPSQVRSFFHSNSTRYAA